MANALEYVVVIVYKFVKHTDTQLTEAKMPGEILMSAMHTHTTIKSNCWHLTDSKRVDFAMILSGKFWATLVSKVGNFTM